MLQRDLHLRDITSHDMHVNVPQHVSATTRTQQIRCLGEDKMLLSMLLGVVSQNNRAFLLQFPMKPTLF